MEPEIAFIANGQLPQNYIKQVQTALQNQVSGLVSPLQGFLQQVGSQLSLKPQTQITNSNDGMFVLGGVWLRGNASQDDVASLESIISLDQFPKSTQYAFAILEPALNDLLAAVAATSPLLKGHPSTTATVNIIVGHLITEKV